MVRKGDVVKKGQILISGIIVDENTEDNILVHAEGEVLAKTRYFYRVDEPLMKVVEEETGEKMEIHEIKFGKKRVFNFF